MFLCLCVCMYIHTVCNQKDPLRRKFVVRMRCAFTPSIRSINRCSNFKVRFYLKTNNYIKIDLSQKEGNKIVGHNNPLLFKFMDTNN